ncbi:DNA polymerase Y family protein [Rhizobium sp. CNPSo 3464]|uniref:Y-family DNA polymerase n=1 Tax=Rhizobium sp. CNPSo 3464 TaxID=3021406 RepID=UPI0025513A52|nr:DNA polymerase Y family protein [Rhizobium sp. CNPSo 3464]MDK4739362.1 DNA polymerase Y family protein [Rhizobium sp. CNPSo 3464]
MRLTALNERAETIGLKLAQGVAEAKAICPALDVVEENPAADRKLLEAIADWCDRYTPLVAIDGKDGLFLDITGCAHLFGGEEALLEDILIRISRLGLDVRGAISSAPGLSWAVARFDESRVVPPEAMEEALAPLPVASLRLGEETVAALQKLGLKQVGDLLAAPRAPLTRRFGAQLLLRLDQAVGLNEEPISPRRPVAQLSAERRLAEPVQAEADILQLARQLAETLKPGLEARGVGGRSFELLLFRIDGMVFRIAAGASQPLREPSRIANLFTERFTAIHDDLDVGYGFEIVRLNVLEHAPFDATQDDFIEEGRQDGSLAAFADRVAARLGPDCLQGFELQESHIPERAVRSIPAVEILAAHRRTGSEHAGHGFFRGERPLRLFRMPEPIETFATEVPDGPPRQFRWRRITHKVLRAEGPERLAAEWWVDEEETPARDYFRIEDEAGHRFWLFRKGLYGQGATRPSWYMHGIFP